MGEVLDEIFYLNFDAQFLPEFAVEALLKGLARFAFAARKFPQAAQVPASGAPGDQKFALAKNQTRGHLNRDFRWRRRTHGCRPGRKSSLRPHRHNAFGPGPALGAGNSE